MFKLLVGIKLMSNQPLLQKLVIYLFISFKYACKLSRRISRVKKPGWGEMVATGKMIVEMQFAWFGPRGLTEQ